jgi:hypothetical protein
MAWNLAAQKGESMVVMSVDMKDASKVVTRVVQMVEVMVAM